MAKKDDEEKSGGIGGYTSVRDMFDGGGAGRSGASFEGSPLSTFGNTLGIRPSGSDRPNPRQSAGLSDFFDGGGYGRSGQRFSGSPYSILANALGVRPAGFQERMGAVRPQMRPMQAAPAPMQPQFMPEPVVTPEVAVTPLDPVGAMPLQDLLAMIEGGISNAEQPQAFVPQNMLDYGDPLGRELQPAAGAMPMDTDPFRRMRLRGY